MSQFRYFCQVYSYIDQSDTLLAMVSRMFEPFANCVIKTELDAVSLSSLMVFKVLRDHDIDINEYRQSVITQEDKQATPEDDYILEFKDKTRATNILRIILIPVSRECTVSFSIDGEEVQL